MTNRAADPPTFHELPTPLGHSNTLVNVQLILRVESFVNTYCI